jgi:hypothetical protein
VYTSCPARSHICTSIAGTAGEGDVIALKELVELGIANGAPKPLDGEIKEELDPLAPEGVAGNENPSEKGPLLAAAEFPKPAEAAPKPMLARLEESAGAEALCPP